jgi:hypothetical protein
MELESNPLQQLLTMKHSTSTGKEQMEWTVGTKLKLSTSLAVVPMNNNRKGLPGETDQKITLAH